VTKLYLSPRQKRLLLELAAEEGTVFYQDLDHMPREEASKRIEYMLNQKRKKERKLV
jgi:hypothetical protein